MKHKIFGSQLAVLLLSQALCFASAFLVFYLYALPLAGNRLTENLGRIAAGYITVAGVLILVFAALGLLWMSLSLQSSVYAPLSRLKLASTQIRDGNLGFELPVAGEPEFRELTAAFEEMRIHLKNSMILAERSDEERRTLMANITHDLKTPVTSILGYSEGILDGVADSPEKVREYAEIICRKAYAIKTLVDDLSLLSLLENLPPLKLTRLDLGPWLAGLAAEVEYEGGAEVTVNAGEGLWCFCDRERLERVMSNLTGNALKYAHQPGIPLRLTFTAERQGEEILLTLRDNGPGLPPAEARKAFERFYRADASRGVVSGSGLGLAIARQIVSLHQGKIWLLNHPEGGLQASVSLPAAKAE